MAVLRLTPGKDGVRMMQTPDMWPLGPVLCLANTDGRLGLLILHTDIRRTEVFELNLHDPRLGHLLQGDPGDIDSTIYATFQQAHDEGWRVD